jgi:photosystem II stability/assembly factor-like uncharacterized protein
MRDDMHIATGVGVIVKKRFVLSFIIAMGSLCLAAPPTFGQNWTNWTLTSAPTNAWSAVACSADGMRIVAAVAGGGIYASADSGTNWNPTSAPSNNWSSVGCSTNGGTLVAAVNDGSIWTSADFGTTWKPSTAPSNDWTGVACSADGTKGVAVAADGIWTSTNAGLDWSSNDAPATGCISVTLSADGTMIAVGGSGTIQISDDAGTSWTDLGGDVSFATWQLITSSADGTKIVAAAPANGYTYATANSGVSWVRGLVYTGSIALSADGALLIGINCPSSFAASVDYGMTWTPLDGPVEPWENVVVVLVADGNELVAVVNGSGIYIWRPVSPAVISQPQSQIAIGGNGVTLEAVVASTSPLTYQWQFNGTNLPGTTSATLTLTDVNVANSGTYVLMASNSFGSILSSNAVLTVVPALLTTESPDPSLYVANLTASITAGFDDTGVWFQWGVDTNYGQVTPTTFVQSVNALTISNLITGLTPYTVYHCQAVASNVFGTALGGDVSFTTVPKFVQVGTNTGWSALVLSADGRELVGTFGGIIYISTNLGVELMPTTGTGSVFAVSSNGSTILADSGTNIYVSMDRGSTWTTNTAPTTLEYFAASSNAKMLVAFGGELYTSTNFGATWSQHTPPYGYTAGLASSADGSHLYGAAFAAYETGAIYGSTDFGNTWTSLGVFYGMTFMGQIACSADGSIIAEAGNSFFMSINGGASWSYVGLGGPTYGHVACSSNGHTLILATYGYLEVSPDTGTTWYLVNPPPFFGDCVMVSADGNTLAVLAYGQIYLSLPPPSESSSLSVARNTSNGLPTLQLTGQPGYNYMIEASTNLINWSYIATLANTNGLVPFTDPASTNCNRRFYRAVAPY